MPSSPCSSLLVTSVALALAASLGAQTRGGGAASGPRTAPSPRPSSSQGMEPSSGLRTSPMQSGSMGNGPGQGLRPAGNGRPASMPLPSSRMIITPGALPRAMACPQPAFWKHRDLLDEIRMIARRGFLPVVQVATTTPVVTDFCPMPSGWRAYGFAVPAQENLHVRLHHGNEGWFRLMAVNRWGQMGSGMVQNLIPTGNPEITYKNLSTAPQVVYVIVDDPGWMSAKENPFTLTVDRSWDPAKKALPPVPVVLGIWAEHKADPSKPGTPIPEAPALTPAPDPVKS